MNDTRDSRQCTKSTILLFILFISREPCGSNARQFFFFSKIEENDKMIAAILSNDSYHGT